MRLVRTLNVRNALLKNLLEDLGVLKLLLDLGNDGLGQLPLLTLLDLALVAHPRIEDGLGLGGDGSLLLELESLGLKLGGFLIIRQRHVLTSEIQEQPTLETSKSPLVMSTTPLIFSTSPMRVLTASVWSARALLRMFLIFSF